MTLGEVIEILQKLALEHGEDVRVLSPDKPISDIRYAEHVVGPELIGYRIYRDVVVIEREY